MISNSKIMGDSKQLTESWNIQKEKLRRKISLLTDQEILFLEWRINNLLRKIQLKFGKSKVEILKLIYEV